MEICSVTSKGQVTIPKSVRQQLGICQGSKISFSVQKNSIELHVVSNPQPPKQSGFGMLKSKLASVAVDLDPASLMHHDRT
jgi:AbrB family looped-hinge helix DNA binding protein